MSSQLTVWEESPQKKCYGSFKNSRFKYWILTVTLDLWRIPETIDILNNVKYIRGQQEFNEKEYLHWHLAVEYFKPAKFHKVKQQFPGAHIEPIYAVSAWNYVWKEQTAVFGSQFELGDDSDVIKAMSARGLISVVKRDEALSTNSEASLADETISKTDSVDIDNLEKKLIDISKALYLLPQSALDLLRNAVEKAENINLVYEKNLEEISLTPTMHLRNAVDEAEMIYLLNSISLEDCDVLLPITPTKNPNDLLKNHGKKWKIPEISELDKLLKGFFTIEEIANHFGRSQKSIVYKTAALINEKLKSGHNLEKAILIYQNKIGCEDILQFQELKERDFRRRKRRRLQLSME